MYGWPAERPGCLASWAAGRDPGLPGWLADPPAGPPGWLPGCPAGDRGCVGDRWAVRPEWLHVRRPRCLPGDAGGPAGKNDRARFRPARLAGEADGKPDESPGPSLAESCDDAISKLN